MSRAGRVVLSREMAVAYDRHCMDELGLAGIALMERAARGCADIALQMTSAGPIVVACGPGQNGGDGYAIARMLCEAGRSIVVVVLGVPRTGSDAAIMRERLGDMQARTFVRGMAVERPELIVDALFGTGLDRPLEDDALEAVRWINAQRVPVLSVDLPSGLDCDRGVPLPECVRASVTATMVAPKLGFARAVEWTGRVEVVPIGGPDPEEWIGHSRPRG
jgi:hydroxyethylthiazole kinase-like uncharacterized protein yjeF